MSEPQYCAKYWGPEYGWQIIASRPGEYCCEKGVVGEGATFEAAMAAAHEEVGGLRLELRDAV